MTSSNDDEVNMDVMNDTWTGTLQTAICSNQVMRTGKHYVKFGFTGGTRFFYMFPGIMRPVNGWDELELSEFTPFEPTFHPYLSHERTDRWGVDSESSVDSCHYYSFAGDCFWCNWGTSTKNEVHWEGMDGARMTIDDTEIGMLLDLDEGTLTVYKEGSH